jgi:hypothetical protein
MLPFYGMLQDKTHRTDCQAQKSHLLHTRLNLYVNCRVYWRTKLQGNDITNKKLSDLKVQTKLILDTLIDVEMNNVFTNDAKYLLARD